MQHISFIHIAMGVVAQKVWPRTFDEPPALPQALFELRSEIGVSHMLFLILGSVRFVLSLHLDGVIKYFYY